MENLIKESKKTMPLNYLSSFRGWCASKIMLFNYVPWSDRCTSKNRAFDYLSSFCLGGRGASKSCLLSIDLPWSVINEGVVYIEKSCLSTICHHLGCGVHCKPCLSSIYPELLSFREVVCIANRAINYSPWSVII